MAGKGIALAAWIRGAGRETATGLALLLGLLGFILLAAGLSGHALTPRLAPPPAADLAGAPPRLAPPPRVEPRVFVPLPADQAKRTNAAIPFAPGAIAPAAPFTYVGTPVDRASALTCLAAAVYYEAGDDAAGEQAVAQVVLNRARHPAFPKTICGVVFQGAERATGCQFTFACDGALGRAPSAPAWERARAIAERALTGHVDKAVGTATHYHADYVVPYWHAALDKLAEVRGQIFYRWRGWWGSPKAFAGHLRPFERIDARLVALGGAGPGAAFTGTAAQAAALFDNPSPPTASLKVPGVGALRGGAVRLMDLEAGQFVLQLDPSARPASYEGAAKALCAGRRNCIVMGWTHADRLPSQMPVPPPRMRTMAFLYRKNEILGAAGAYWNCHQVTGAPGGRCLPGTEP